MDLDTLSATDRGIAVMWEKASRSLRDSRHHTLHPEAAFILAEHAALQGSAAVLRAAGQWEISRGYHYGIFARITAMNAGELSPAARGADKLCARCRAAVRGSAPPVEREQADRLRGIAGRLLTAAYAWLREARPGLTLSPPPGPPG